MSKFQAQEEEIGRLKEWVQVLEDSYGVATKQSGEDDLIKGRSNNEGEVAAERISNDSEEIVKVLTSMDAATVLTGEIVVPTDSGFIPTAGPPNTVISTGSEVGPTASPIVIRRKGKEVMVESDTPKKRKLQEQIDAHQREACPTDSGFIADQDRATIAKSSTLPHDLALRVTSPAVDEGKAVATKQSGEDAPIKGRSNNEGKAAAERISNDSEEIARVLTSMDAATVLAGEIDVPTSSGFIPITGPPATVISISSEVGPIASPIVIRRKGKEVMVESDTPKKKKLQKQIDAQVGRELEEQQEREDIRMNEQIARDAEVARIHAE
nr:hypothetical protein [Tanacetum cinerariifolium]